MDPPALVIGMSYASSLRALFQLCLLVAGLDLLGVSAFDNTLYDNTAVYWGQNSYGATHSDDSANWQQPISYYCQDDAIDVIPIAFVNTFFGEGGVPEINLANTCNPTNDSYFSGTELLDCSFLASDIEQCQSKGKIVTISLGGAGGGVGFQNDSQAQQLADTIWNVFLGGSSSTRPFGSAVLDGVDLDIEGGSTTGYAAFVTQLRSHFNGANKDYYVSGAPQCVYPDQYLGDALDNAYFDMVYVQFYNNQCGLQNYDDASVRITSCAFSWKVLTPSGPPTHVGLELWAVVWLSPFLDPDLLVNSPSGTSGLARSARTRTSKSTSAPPHRAQRLAPGTKALRTCLTLRLRCAIHSRRSAVSCYGTPHKPIKTTAMTLRSRTPLFPRVVQVSTIRPAQPLPMRAATLTRVTRKLPTTATSGRQSTGRTANLPPTQMVIGCLVSLQSLHPTDTDPIPAVSACSGAASSGTTSISSATSTSSAGGSTTTSASGSGNCAGVAAWSSSTAYTGGSEVQYKCVLVQRPRSGQSC
ncbi:hypothetical protein AcV5_004257 [Taiwanofungus camphoratus]|nr:hypothetical protein AcV5_004257 [Antrodia cinnamomea]